MSPTTQTLKDCFTLLRSILMQRTYRTGTWQKGSRCGTGYDAKTSSGTLTTFTLISFLPTAALTTTTRTTRSRRKNLFRGTKERGTTSNHSSSSLQTLIFAYRLAQKIKINYLPNFKMAGMHNEQCDQIGRFIAFWATFPSLWQQLFCPNRPHFRQVL